MPRSGGTYTLPSPPNPLVANTLAKAADMNTTFSDLATALTGSVPVDGSAPMTGNLNVNGHNVTNAGTVATSAFAASSANITTLQIGTQLQIDSGTGYTWDFYVTGGRFVESFITGSYWQYDPSVGAYTWYTGGPSSFLAMELTGGGNLLVHGAVTPGGVLLSAPQERSDTPLSDLREMFDSGTIDVGRAIYLLGELIMERVPA